MAHHPCILDVFPWSTSTYWVRMWRHGGCKVIRRPFPLLGSCSLTKNVSLRTGVKLANEAPWLEATLSQRGKRGIWLGWRTSNLKCVCSLGNLEIGGARLWEDLTRAEKFQALVEKFLWVTCSGGHLHRSSTSFPWAWNAECWTLILMGISFSSVLELGSKACQLLWKGETFVCHLSYNQLLLRFVLKGLQPFVFLSFPWLLGSLFRRV